MNKWQTAKQVQKRFWDEFELIITRDQAFEVMASMKIQQAMFGLDGRYTSTTQGDDIRGASKRGVQYGGYQTFYSVREWNNAVVKGEFGTINNIDSLMWHSEAPTYNDDENCLWSGG